MSPPPSELPPEEWIPIALRRLAEQGVRTAQQETLYIFNGDKVLTVVEVVSFGGRGMKFIMVGHPPDEAPGICAGLVRKLGPKLGERIHLGESLAPGLWEAIFEAIAAYGELAGLTVPEKDTLLNKLALCASAARKERSYA
jgi:hypothetical protein